MNVYPRNNGVLPGFATVVTDNPLAEGWSPPTDPEGGRVVLYSGWLGEEPEQGVEGVVGVWANSFQTWGPAGRAAFSALTERLVEPGSGRLTVCFRPHARHVLADPQTCLSFLRAQETNLRGDGSWGFEVLLDPVAMLTADMLPDAEDHLRRAFEALADRPDVPAVLLSNAERVMVEKSDELRACPPGSGVLDPDVLRRLFADHWPSGKPVFKL